MLIDPFCGGGGDEGSAAQSAESGLWFNSLAGMALAVTYVRHSCFGRPRALHHRAVVPAFVQHHAHHRDEGDLHAGNHATHEKPRVSVFTAWTRPLRAGRTTTATAAAAATATTVV